MWGLRGGIPGLARDDGVSETYLNTPEPVADGRLGRTESSGEYRQHASHGIS
jgi:hypothetical protein